MIRLFQRLLLFSGLQKKRLIRSFLAYLVSSFFEMIPIMAILTVLTGILKQLSGDVMPESTIWISLGIMIVSIVGRIVFVNLSANARTLGSFAFGSEKRMEIGERLKRAPMGYFNENRLGDITAAVTTTLGDLEQLSVTIMENVLWRSLFIRLSARSAGNTRPAVRQPRLAWSLPFWNMCRAWA